MATYRPATLRALAVSIGADIEHESLGLYIADVLWLLLKATAGDRIKLQPFSEIQKHSPSKEAQKAEVEMVRQKIEDMLNKFSR